MSSKEDDFSFFLLKPVCNKLFRYKFEANVVINRPGEAGAVLETASSLINSLIESSFSSRSLKYHKSQTVRARELKF